MRGFLELFWLPFWSSLELILQKAIFQAAYIFKFWFLTINAYDLKTVNSDQDWLVEFVQLLA